MHDYDERLVVPGWWWVSLGLIAAAVVATLLLSGLPALLMVPWFVAVALGAAVMVGWNRTRVQVADGELRAGRAHIPVDLLGPVRVLDAASTRRRAGPRADPAAFLVLRSWIRESIEAAVLDPADPTPYWLISTRHPRLLASAVESARSQPGGERPGEVPPGGDRDAGQPQPG